MKLRLETSGGAVHVWIKGAVDGEACHCLDHFWDHSIDERAREVSIDMTAVDEIDAIAVASLVNRIRDHLSQGARVSLIAPPQMLAHTLYKAGHLTPESGRDQVAIEPRRAEEPYAG